MERDTYLSIADMLISCKEVKSQAKKGHCRTWTAKATEYIAANFPEAQVEAREVHISSGMDHTFLRVIVPEERPYIFDGTGVEKFGPYFGYEDNAPPHLRSSHPDMINYVGKGRR